MTPKAALRLSSSLTDWFKDIARPLPWRVSYDPYGVWVSEIMCQQTRIETVLPYYRRWMERLPGVKALAQVSGPELLKLWEGLGYYSRARNLQKAAAQILEHHQGNLPTNRSDLESLPGIGPYTAGAILSIAFNQPEPLLDGNIERVLSRVLDLPENVRAKPGRERLTQAVTALLQAGEPRQVAQGLMELGALVCLPQTPQCLGCPLLGQCLAQERGTWSDRPQLPPRPATVKEKRLVLVFSHQGRYYLEPQPKGQKWAGMLLFPLWLQAEWPSLEGLKEQLWDRYSLRPQPQELGRFKYNVTCYQVEAWAWQLPLESKPQWPGLWLSGQELGQLGLPRPSLLTLGLLGSARLG